MAKPPEGLRLVGIVRDGTTGLPKFDDPLHAPREMIDMLTQDEIDRMDDEVVRKLDRSAKMQGGRGVMKTQGRERTRDADREAGERIR